MPQRTPPPSPPLFWRALKCDEQQTYQTGLQEWDTWAGGVVPIFNSLPHSQKTKAIDKLLMVISDTYHNITSSHALKPIKADKHFQDLKTNIPPPSCTTFNSRMKELQTKLDDLQLNGQKADVKKLHRNLVRGIQLKRTLREAMAPPIRGPTALYTTPFKQHTTNDTGQMTQVMADSFHELGGDTNFNPPDQGLNDFLAYTPQNSNLHSLHVPHIHWDQLLAKIRNLKPSNAGG